jgi:hypothetical protein
MVNHVTISLQGGLGNQFFQLAFLLFSQKITGNQIFLDLTQSPSTRHSREDYLETVLSKWKLYCASRTVDSILTENSKLAVEDWKTRIQNVPGNVKLNGYFQRSEYTDLVRQEFIDLLTFDESVLQKYDSSSTFFIHVRGGDYLGNRLHFIDLKQYYTECMSRHPGEEFIIFTNDISYARSLFPNIPIIQESEVDTLLLMSRAKGCICANSSFSWWGAYLNPERPIYLPSRWTTDPSMDTSGFYFKGSTKIPV